MSFTDNTTGRFEWGTPQRFFDELNMEFGFTVDVCANKELAKCQKYYDKETDGLKQDWTGEVCWMNPPYGRDIAMWLKKAYESRATVVCLVPSRTDNKWWHQWVMMADEIRFVKGRLRFHGAGDGAKFPSALVIFKGHNVKLRGDAPAGAESLSNDRLGLGMETIIPSPDNKRDLVNKLVIGTSFAPLAFGHEFCIAHCGFFNGTLLFPLFNALVYDGDEITIGGRKLIREKGDEFWVVRFSEERFEFDRLFQSESPNVELSRRPTPNEETKK